MAASRLCQRTFSAFKPSTRLWAPVSSRCAPNQATQHPALTSHFSLITQNLDAFSPRPIARANLLLGGILKESKRPDIIFLQVTSGVRTSILGNPKVREAFLVTDAEDRTSFDGVPFANMTLLSNKRFAFGLELQKEEDGVERGRSSRLVPFSASSSPASMGGVRFP